MVFYIIASHSYLLFRNGVFEVPGADEGVLAARYRKGNTPRKDHINVCKFVSSLNNTRYYSFLLAVFNSVRRLAFSDWVNERLDNWNRSLSEVKFS